MSIKDVIPRDTIGVRPSIRLTISLSNRTPPFFKCHCGNHGNRTRTYIHLSLFLCICGALPIKLCHVNCMKGSIHFSKCRPQNPLSMGETATEPYMNVSQRHIQRLTAIAYTRVTDVPTTTATIYDACVPEQNPYTL